MDFSFNQILLCSSWKVPVTLRFSPPISCTKLCHPVLTTNLHTELRNTAQRTASNKICTWRSETLPKPPCCLLADLCSEPERAIKERELVIWLHWKVNWRYNKAIEGEAPWCLVVWQEVKNMSDWNLHNSKFSSTSQEWTLCTYKQIMCYWQ